VIPRVARDVSTTPIPKARIGGRGTSEGAATVQRATQTPSFAEALRGAATSHAKAKTPLRHQGDGLDHRPFGEEPGAVPPVPHPTVWSAHMPVAGDVSSPPPACGGADGSGGERTGPLNDRKSASAVADVVSAETRAAPGPRGHLSVPTSHPEASVLALATHAMPALPPCVSARSATPDVALAVRSGASAAATMSAIVGSNDPASESASSVATTASSTPHPSAAVSSGSSRAICWPIDRARFPGGAAGGALGLWSDAGRAEGGEVMEPCAPAPRAQGDSSAPRPAGPGRYPSRGAR
jgi:hypothetical protein